MWYYVTVISGLSQQNVTISLWQTKQVQGLRNMTHIVDRMWNSNDLVKYYYVEAPTKVYNYTAQVTIYSKTPGFQPLVYLQSNSIINDS